MNATTDSEDYLWSRRHTVLYQVQVRPGTTGHPRTGPLPRAMQ